MGFEIFPYYYIYAKIKTWKYRNINVQYHNINKVNLSRADVIYCYLMPKFLKKLAPKFRRELKPGSRLISIGFPLSIINTPALKIKKKINGHKVFIYEF